MSMQIRFLVLSGTLLLAACSTPEPVRDLAKTTAATVSLYNTTLIASAENSRRTADSRGRYIADVNDAALDLIYDYQERVGAMRRVENKKMQKAGETKSAMIDSVLAYLDELNAEADAAIAKQAALETSLAETQGKFELPSDDLKLLAKTLGILTEERDNKEILAFLKQFFGEVVTQLKATETAAEAANATAENGARSSSDSALNSAAKDKK